MSVLWWAGGKGGDSSLVSRLRGRSRRLVREVAASGRRRGLVAFVSGGWSSSPGSWATVREAVQAGVPVVVFPFVPVSGGSGVRWGFSAAPRGFRSLPSLARWCGPGRWVVAGSGPVWSRGFRWEPDYFRRVVSVAE